MANFQKIILSVIFGCMLVGCDQKAVNLKDPLFKQEPKITPRWFKDISEPANSCKPQDESLGQNDCPEYHICVPEQADKSKGTCMIECGANVGGKLIKRPDACPQSYRCMLMRNLDLSPIGMFCQKPQERREMMCQTPLDADACLDGLSCLATVTGSNDAGLRIHTRYRCKRECSVDNPCEGTESCLSAKYGRKQVQSLCDIKACENNDASCACDKALGYRCAAIMSGLSAGVCTRDLGICGQPIAWAKASDFHGKSFLGENCNELNDSRLCQNFDSGEAKPRCQNLSKSGEGVCIAPCMIPAADGQSFQSLSCPKDYTCQKDVAKKLGLVVLLKENDQLKHCDEKLCPKGKPCASCGSAEAECIRLDDEDGKGHFCVSFVGTCLAN